MQSSKVVLGYALRCILQAVFAVMKIELLANIPMLARLYVELLRQHLYHIQLMGVGYRATG